MNEQNFDYLKNQVKFTGFGEALETQLKEQISKGEPAFTLAHKAEYGKDEVNSVLHFRKSEQTDMYFFNKYDMSLKKPGDEAAVNQTFYIGKDNNITLKEGYNLLDGRSVNKDLVNRENEKYNAWVQMDFKETDKHGNYKLRQFHENFGYDLEKALEKHPIKELNNEEDKNMLMDSLKKGNRQSVTFLSDGQEQKRFLEASPQFKTVNVYDSNMKRVSQSKSQKESQGQSAEKSQKESPQQDEDGTGPQKARRRKKSKGIA